MKYTIKYIGPGWNSKEFYYPMRIAAYNDLGVGEGPDGSYLVLHVTDDLKGALFYDTPEKAKELLDLDIFGVTEAPAACDYDIFEALGVMEVPEKLIFKKKLEG